MRGHIPTTEEKKLLVENKCKDLNFTWLNKDDWIYTNWEDKTLQVEFMRENWPIKSRININLNVLFKTHGTKGLYFREDEVKSYINWFCNEKNLTWENRDNWNFSKRTDKNIKIRCNECGKEEYVSFRILLERKVGCTECLRRSMSIEKDIIHSRIRALEKSIEGLVCLDLDNSYISENKTYYRFSYKIVDESGNKTNIIWRTNFSNLSSLVKSIENGDKVSIKNSSSLEIIGKELFRRIDLLKEKYKFYVLTEIKDDDFYKFKDRLRIFIKPSILIDVQIRDLVCHINLSGLFLSTQKSSSSESEVSHILNRLEINYIPQKRFDWLVNKSKLSLDFYLPDYNLCIECQGEQHFHPVDFFGGEKTFEIVKFRDNLKRTLCSEHNIKLIYYISIDTYNKLFKLSIEENVIVGEKELINFLRGLEKTDHEFNIDYYLENLKTSRNDRVRKKEKYKRKKQETSNKKKRRLDKETCFNLAKKYNSLHELISNDSSLYTVSRNNGWITEYTWLDRSRIVPESSKRPVVRYSKEGLFIDEYSSIREASDTLGINSTSIGGICRHKEGLITAGGYIWYYRDELIELYNEIPEIVDSYQSRTKVGELTYENCLNYAKTCKTKSEFYKKHYLAFQESNKNGWIKDYTWFSTTNKISVVRFSKEGDYIDEYESTTSAGTILGISRDLISKSCNFKRLFKGFYWRYKSDVLDENGEVLKKIEIDPGEKS